MTGTSPSKPKPTPLKILQQRISIVTWCITLILSLRGLFTFYGMKEKGFIEQTINFITEPLVQFFKFEQIESLSIPGTSVLVAIIYIFILGQLAQLSVWFTNQRLTHPRGFIYRHGMRSNTQT